MTNDGTNKAYYISDGFGSEWAKFTYDANTREVVQWEVVRPGKIQECARYKRGEIGVAELEWARGVLSDHAAPG